MKILDMKNYNKIKISDRFLRSINIQSDANDSTALKDYISSPSSSKLLSDMCAHLRTKTQNSFTWTGPYGSGKSSLAILFQALGNSNTKKFDIAKNVIGKDLATEVATSVNPNGESKHFLNLVGQPEDFETFLSEQLSLKYKNVIKDNGNVIKNLKLILKHLSSNKEGLVLIVDEMGKFLEYSAKSNGEIYILQQIAELANRSDGKLIFIGILHQSFADYANKLSRESRDEWSKIQGRFIDHSLNLSGEEQLSLISNAINSNVKARTNKSIPITVAEVISSNRNTQIKQTAELLDRCFPLHPISAALVGHAAKRAYGQNQRSIFSFLNSAENFGFQHFINKNRPPSLYEPHMFWDYLKYNLENSIILSGDSSRWQVARDAIIRAETTQREGKLIDLIKSIAVIDMFRELSGIPANIKTLSTLTNFSSQKELKKNLQTLERQSLIVYRKFRNSYSIFAGSDFDIDKALSEQLSKFNASEQSETLEIDFAPILAKRHFHQTGTLRWLKVVLAFKENIQNVCNEFIPKNDEFGLAIICLGAEKKTLNDIQSSFDWGKIDYPVWLTFSSNKNELISYAKEIQALKNILLSYPELRGDKTAVSEIELRISILEQAFRSKASALVESADWANNSEICKNVSQQKLSGLASDSADKIFHSAPIIKSELLNRNKPSSSANAAQNQLLKCMVAGNGKEKLGIEGYPAEAGLFFTILDPLKLYIQSNDDWKFANPQELSKKSPIAKLWKFTDKFIKNSSTAVPLDHLYALWGKPPFGLKKGTLAILATAYILSREEEVVFYRDEHFQPRLAELDTEVLTSNPVKISLRWMKMNEFSKKVLKGISELTSGSIEEKGETSTPLGVAKRLIEKFDNLQLWTMKTLLLTSTAKQIRTKMKVASDPNKLLFEDLFNESESFDHQFLAFTEAFQELSEFYFSKINELEGLMLIELDIHTKSHESLESLNDRAAKLNKLSGDFEIEAFVNRIKDYSGSLEEMEGVAALSISKPTRMWTDSDYLNAKLNLRKLCQKFRDLEVYSTTRGSPKNRNRIVLITDDKTDGIQASEVSFLGDDDCEIKSQASSLLKSIDQFGKFNSEKKAAILVTALKQIGGPKK